MTFLMLAVQAHIKRGRRNVMTKKFEHNSNSKSNYGNKHFWAEVFYENTVK